MSSSQREEMLKLKKLFQAHKDSAKARKIPFIFTFDGWMKVWLDSGHFHQRGKRSHEYCMARHEDKGAYEVGNISIITNYENNTAKSKCRAVKEALNRQDIKHRVSEAIRAACSRPERKEQMRRTSRSIWSSPEMREVQSKRVQQLVRRKDNTSGYKGVCFFKRGK